MLLMKFFSVPKPWFLVFCLGVAPLAVLGLGCKEDTTVPVVDFSKTVAVERPKEISTNRPYLNVAIGAMISPKETFTNYYQLLEYLGKELDHDIRLVQRKTYGEINELLGKGEVDIAFICSGPYAAGKAKYAFEILATPQVHGSHFYRAYLIVQKESPFQRLEDLRGKVFAFTDPESNTGHLVPLFWLREIEERPETFFGKTLYTYSHDNSILAVSKGMVNGASVDGLIWEYYHAKNSPLTSKTRIIKESEPFGTPPVVASKHLAPEIKEQIRQALFSMHTNPEGQNILKELMIDRFEPPKDEWYDRIREMLTATTPLPEEKTRVSAKPQR